MKKISKGASIFLIAVAMIISAVAVTADTEEQAIKTYCDGASGTTPGTLGPIVWDNGMNYYLMIAAQYEPSYGELGTVADDFMFEQATEVADVHWVGGYFGDYYANGAMEWNITFYYDVGNGEYPGSIFAGPYIIAWDDIGQIFIQDTGTSIWYELHADLPEIVTFPAGEKFWMSIRGEGVYPPQSGACLQQTVTLHMAVWKSTYFSVPDWLDTDLQWPDHGPMDLCFQLTGPTPPTPPTPPTIDGPSEGGAGVELCWTFHSSDENGDQVKYFIDWGDGTTDETEYSAPCTPVQVCHTYESKGDYVITAYAEDETGLTGDSNTFDISIPRARSVYHPLVLRLFERFPNVFPILRQLLGL